MAQHPVDIGPVLAHARKRLHLSIASVAKDIGISRQCLSRIEHGKDQPSLDVLKRLAQHLRIPHYAVIAFIFDDQRKNAQYLMHTAWSFNQAAMRALSRSSALLSATLLTACRFIG